jgi:hypothetical protein
LINLLQNDKRIKVTFVLGKQLIKDMKLFQIWIFGFFFASVLSWSEDEVEMGCGYESCPKEVPGRSD